MSLSYERVRRWLVPGLVTAASLIAATMLWITRGGDGAGWVGAPAGTPVLTVNREAIDLGRVPLGEWVEASFVLTNTGDDTLRIGARPWVEIVEGC